MTVCIVVSGSVFGGMSFSEVLFRCWRELLKPNPDDINDITDTLTFMYSHSEIIPILLQVLVQNTEIPIRKLTLLALQHTLRFRHSCDWDGLADFLFEVV
jgi:hypothetical protein